MSRWQKKEHSDTVHRFQNERKLNEQLTSDVKTLKAEIATLKQSYSTLESTKQTLDENLVASQTQVQLLQSECEERKNKEISLLKDIDQRQRTLQALEDEKSKINREKDALYNDLRQALEKATASEYTNRLLADEVQSHNFKYLDAEAQLKSTKMYLDNANLELADKTRELNALKERIHELNRVHGDSSQELQSVKSEFESLLSRMNATDSEKSNVESRLLYETEESSTLRATLNRVREENHKLEELVSRLKLDNETLELNNQRIQTMYSELQSNTASKSISTLHLETELERVVSDRDTLQRKFADLEQTYEMESTFYKQLNTDLEDTRGTIRILEEKLAKSSLELSQVKRTAEFETDRAQSFARNLSLLQDQSTHTQHQVQEAQMALEAETKLCKELQSALKTAQMELELMKKNAGKLENESGTLRSNTEQLRMEANEKSLLAEALQRRVDSLESKVSSTESELKNLRSQLGQTLAALESEKSSNQDFAMEKERLRKQRDELQIIIDGNLKEVQALVIARDDVCRKAEEMKRTIQELRDEVDKANQTIREEKENYLQLERAGRQNKEIYSHELEESRVTIVRCQQTAEALRNEALSHAKDKVAAATTIQQLERKLEHNAQVIERLTAETERCQQEISEIKDREMDLNRSLSAMESQKRSDDISMRHYQMQETSLRTQLEDERKLVSETRKSLSEALHNKNAMQDKFTLELAQKSEQILQLKSEVKGFTEELEKVSHSLSALKKIKSEDDASLADTREELNSEINAHMELQRRFQALREECEALNTRNLQVSSSLASTKDELLAAFQKTAQTDVFLSQERQKSEHLHNELRTAMAKFNDVQYEVSVLNTRIQQLQELQTHTAQKESKLRHEMKELQQENDRLTTKLRAEGAENDESRVALKAQYFKLKKETDERNIQLSECRARESELESHVKELTSRIKHLTRDSEDKISKLDVSLNSVITERDRFIHKYHNACIEASKSEKLVHEWHQKYLNEFECFEQQKKNYETAIAQVHEKYRERERQLRDKIKPKKRLSEHYDD
eukprot:PhF_6_TR24828/c0_g1_i2/m.34233